MRHLKRIAVIALLHVVLLTVLMPLCARNDAPARAVYRQYCADCHGADLQGGMAQSLVNGVWQFGQDRNYIHSNIKFGLPHLGMPGYEETLTDAQIRQLVDFLLAEQDQAKVTRPPIPAEPWSLEDTAPKLH
jgi:mono/diheme cytochrome c family protein